VTGAVYLPFTELPKGGHAPPARKGTSLSIQRPGGVVAIALIALTLSGCAVNEQNLPETDSDLAGTLIGAGSSAQQSAQEAWVAGFQSANPDVTVEYDPIGSGGGRDTFAAGGSQFAGTDRAFNDEEVAADEFAACVPGSGIVEIPNLISPIAVIFHLDGVESLDLDAATIAGIFAGTVTNWNDPAIAEQNPGVDLPDLTITAVHRADDSGTTANFTEYLAANAPEVWAAGAVDSWPEEYPGEAAPQTSGVVDAVTNGTGTIGYADASRAGDLGTVAVRVGEDYVRYSPEAASAIVDVSTFVPGRGPYDLALELERDTAEAGVYPVVLISYLVGCVEYLDPSRVELVKAYFSYIVSPEGQAAAADAAGSAPMSESLREKAVAAIEAMR
jgi:phosphate transport system substrate-binding protein